MRQRRGQAFETMMLVISVIVALAILGVLMNILGGLGGGIGSDPKQAVLQKVQAQAGQPGASTAAKIKVTTDGYSIRKDDVLRDTTILTGEVQFICAEDAETAGLCGGDTITDTAITLKKADYFFVVCGYPERDGVKYGIAFGRTAASADGACVEENLD
ncbi:hypothetical protein H0O03_03795 [Candidatus Micrarchaeota archaeon]|nr:hypothetical protein [Candidatus Micrarchaeota archaeon]